MLCNFEELTLFVSKQGKLFEKDNVMWYINAKRKFDQLSKEKYFYR